MARQGDIVLIDLDPNVGHEQAGKRPADNDHLLQDPVKAVVHGFTHLGLMEITRKKSGTRGLASCC